MPPHPEKYPLAVGMIHCDKVANNDLYIWCTLRHNVLEVPIAAFAFKSR